MSTTNTSTELDKARAELRVQAESFTESFHEFFEQAEALIAAINTLLEPNSDGDSPEHNAWRLSQVLLGHFAYSDLLAQSCRLLGEGGAAK